MTGYNARQAFIESFAQLRRRQPRLVNMQDQNDRLLNWKVTIDEVTVGVYRLSAIHPQGQSIEATGTNPDDLLKRARTDAEKIEHELQKRNSAD